MLMTGNICRGWVRSAGTVEDTWSKVGREIQKREKLLNQMEEAGGPLLHVLAASQKPRVKSKTASSQLAGKPHHQVPLVKTGGKVPSSH